MSGRFHIGRALTSRSDETNHGSKVRKPEPREHFVAEFALLRRSAEIENEVARIYLCRKLLGEPLFIRIARRVMAEAHPSINIEPPHVLRDFFESTCSQQVLKFCHRRSVLKEKRAPSDTNPQARARRRGGGSFASFSLRRDRGG